MVGRTPDWKKGENINRTRAKNKNKYTKGPECHTKLSRAMRNSPVAMIFQIMQGYKWRSEREKREKLLGQTRNGSQSGMKANISDTMAR